MKGCNFYFVRAWRFSMVRAFQNGINEVCVFVVQKIWHNIFSMQKVWMLNNCWCRHLLILLKSTVKVQCSTTFIFNIISKNVIIFENRLLFHKINNKFNLRKNCYFWKQDYLRLHNCVEIFHATNVYYTV